MTETRDASSLVSANATNALARLRFDDRTQIAYVSWINNTGERL